MDHVVLVSGSLFVSVGTVDGGKMEKSSAQKYHGLHRMKVLPPCGYSINLQQSKLV